MRIIALEEHVSLPEMAARIPGHLSQQRGWPADKAKIAHGNADRLLKLVPAQ